MLCIRANAWQSIQFLLDGGLSCSLSLSVSACMSLALSLSLSLLAGASVLLAGVTRIKTATPDIDEEIKQSDPLNQSVCPLIITLSFSLFSPSPCFFFFSSLFETSGLVVISQKRIKPADRERGGAFWSEMANRNILLLFCGLFLLALIQPSLQGGKCITAGEWSHNYCCINQRFRTGAKKFCS